MSEPFGKALPQQASVGYIVKMFPRVSETFILNEILELERQGLSLRIFSLKRPTESVVHAQGKLVRAPITYLPERIYREPLRILRAQLAVSRSRPRCYRDTLNSLIYALFRHHPGNAIPENVVAQILPGVLPPN